MPLSRNVSLVAIWNWYVRAPGTGAQANEGVRWKTAVVGAATPADEACPTSRSEARASRDAMRARRTVIPRFRHARSCGRPSNEGCEGRAGGEDARVVAGPADELDRGRQP